MEDVDQNQQQQIEEDGEEDDGESAAPQQGEEEGEGEAEEEQKEGASSADSTAAGEDVPAAASASAAFVATPAASSRRKSSRAASADFSMEGGAGGLTDDTPTRLSRLDEKSELQGLNKRLEFYILNRRERDASADGWVRELEALKNKHAADLEHQKKLFENQLGLVRKNRDELSAALSKMEGENAHQANAIRELQARLGLEHKARGALEGRVDALQKELLTAQNGLHAGSLAISNLQHEYAALKTSHDDLEASLDSSRKTQEMAQSKANKLAQQYGDLSDEYDTLQTRTAADVKKYESEIHQLCQENHRSVDGIRADCEARLNGIFAERQVQYENDKAEALAVMKTTFDEKLLGYRTRLEELGHELEQEKSNHKAAARALDKENRNVVSLLSELKQAQTALAAAEQALANERANPELARQLADKQETIRRLKVSFKRKDLEFDELMDVKIMLDLEIKAYRTLLDQEDLRVGNIKIERAALQARQDEQERQMAELRVIEEMEAKNNPGASNSTSTTTSSSYTKSSKKSSSTTSKSSRKSKSTAAAIAEAEAEAQKEAEVQAAAAQASMADEPTPDAEGQEGGSAANESEEGQTKTEEEEAEAPSRKRRRASGAGGRRKSSRAKDDSAAASTSAASTSAPIDELEPDLDADIDVTTGARSTGATLFSRVDASGEYVAMKNNTPTTAPLEGWSVRVPGHGVEFQFGPGVELKSGATFYITSAEDVSRARSDKGDQVGRWPTPIEWSDAGEEALLIHPNGGLVAKVAVTPRVGSGGGRTMMQLSAEGQPEVVAGGAAAAAADKQQCIVM